MFGGRQRVEEGKRYKLTKLTKYERFSEHNSFRWLKLMPFCSRRAGTEFSEVQFLCVRSLKVSKGTI